MWGKLWYLLFRATFQLKTCCLVDVLTIRLKSPCRNVLFIKRSCFHGPYRSTSKPYRLSPPFTIYSRDTWMLHYSHQEIFRQNTTTQLDIFQGIFAKVILYNPKHGHLQLVGCWNQVQPRFNVLMLTMAVFIIRTFYYNYLPCKCKHLKEMPEGKKWI